MEIRGRALRAVVKEAEEEAQHPDGLRRAREAGAKEGRKSSVRLDEGSNTT